MLATQIEVSDGTLHIINIGIVFFNQSDISVSLDQSDQPLVLGVDYVWSTATAITFLPSVNVPGGLVPLDVQVIIRRGTKNDEMYNIFDGGAPFSRLALDENYKQLLRLSQEYSEGLGLDGLRNNLSMNGYRITHLGDARDPTDAANKKQVDAALDTAKDYAENLVSGVVGGYGYFQQDGPGAVGRTFQSKMRDQVSVMDFAGVDPTGVTDSTAGFLLAGPGAWVPRGFFLVDSMAVELTQYEGPGVIYTLGGQTIRLDNTPQSTHYVQRKVMEIEMGFDGSPVLPDTQIYPGAQNAPQGLALDRDPVTGERFFYVSQGVSGTSWASDEHVRISKWAYREDGLPQQLHSMTPPLRSSHAHLSTLREGGKLWMYQSATTPIGAINATSEAGKGWSKTEWKAGSNVDADVVSYNVWGRPGSGHRYQNYGKGCVQVSQDGRYMILIGINYSGGAGGRTLFVYDRKAVEAMADPLLAEPVFTSHALKAMDNDAGTAYQGETTDGRYVYICWGSSAVFSRRGVSIYTLTGEKVRDIVFEGPAEMYSADEIRNGHPTYGTCVSFEAEGISIQGGAIHVNFVDYWRAVSTVVSYYGINYVNTQSTNLNNPPSTNPIYWRPTDRAASGPWSDTTTYGFSGSPNTRRTKCVYAIEPIVDGDARQMPCVSGYMFPYSTAVNPTSSSELVDVSVPLGEAYSGTQHNVNNDTYRYMFRYSFNYTFDVRDCREGSDNTMRAMVRASGIIGGAHSAQFGAGDGTATGGAFVTTFATTSAVTPGSVRTATAVGVAGVESRTLVNGVTKVNISETENVTYQVWRPINDLEVDLGTIARRFLTVRANAYTVGASTCTITSGTGTPEGVVTAGVGSIFMRRDAATALYVKQTGTGNTGWVAK